MNGNLNRRAFLCGGIYLLSTALIRAEGHPQPQIHKLARRRSLRGLEALEKAFGFIESPVLDAMAPGRYPIDGDRVYATIVVDRTRAPETAQFEAHRRYTDLHYLVHGSELIGSAPAAELREAKAYTPEVEAALYERPRKYRRLLLKPGEFVVFFPGQAHMPGCYAEKSEEIKKVVVKVLLSDS